MKIFLLIIAFFVFISAGAQNVGIGTTNPTKAKLEVVGVASTNGNTSVIFGSDGQGVSMQRNWPTIGFNQFRDYNVGTGTYLGTGYAAVQYMDPSTGNMYFNMLGTGAANTGTNTDINALAIYNNGNIGIRRSTPNSSLHIARGDGADGTIMIESPEVGYSSHFNYSTSEDTYIRSGAVAGNLYINQIPNGNVYFGGGSSRIGINIIGSIPASTVDINTATESGARMVLVNDYGHYWSQYNNGSLFFQYLGNTKGLFYSTGGYVVGSDLRLKNNIQPLPSVLEKINKLRPSRYEMINHNPSHRLSIGFIAQDVKKVFPEFVHVLDDHNKKGTNHKDLHTMNYSGFFVVGIKALQEQYQQIIDLQKENNELMERLLLLEKKIIAY
ncbi:MAG: tail fiber domain-containing protein [Bacteroidota bacterium]